MARKGIEKKIEAHEGRKVKIDDQIKQLQAELKQLRTMRFTMDFGSTTEIECYRDYDEDCRIQLKQGRTCFWIPAKHLRSLIDNLDIMEKGLSNSEFYPHGKEVL